MLLCPQEQVLVLESREHQLLTGFDGASQGGARCCPAPSSKAVAFILSGLKVTAHNQLASEGCGRYHRLDYSSS
jgi:hypothetical protein